MIKIKIKIINLNLIKMIYLLQVNKSITRDCNCSCAYNGLCFSSNFPAKDGDMSPISETLVRHATYPSAPSVSSGWKRNLLWCKDNSEVWFVHLDPFWADFFSSSENNKSSKTKPLPFIGTVPVTAWIDPDKGEFVALTHRFVLGDTEYCSKDY